MLIAKGIKVATSLEYSFIIAIANPVGPLLCTLIADRIERKWQVCLGAVGIGVFAMLFANSEVPAMLILLGVLVTLCKICCPTASTAINLTCSRPASACARSALSIPGAGCRLHSPASSWRFCFHLGGVNAVFGFIAFAMAIVVITIGGFGPRTRGLALEAIAH